MGLDVLNHVSGDLLIDVRRGLLRKLGQRGVASLDHVVDSVEIDLSLISVSDGHVLVYFNDTHLGGFQNAPHVGDLRSDVEVSVFVHRSDLEESDVQSAVIVLPVNRQFIEHHRNIPATAGFAHFTVEGTEVG